MSEPPVAPSVALAQLRAAAGRERVRRRAATGVLAVAVLLALSGVSPALGERLAILLTAVPFPVVHTAATTTVLSAAALAATARGLRLGSRLAWAGGVSLSLTLAALSLLKGLDWEEAIVAVALACALVVRRDAFPLRPSATALRKAAVVAFLGPIVVVSLATGLTMLLGRHAHPHVGESLAAAAQRLGGDSALPLVGLSSVANPMLAAAVIGIVAVVASLLVSPRPARRLSGAEHLAERERTRRVVEAHGSGSLDYFALRDDKDWFRSGDGVVAYALVGNVCLVSPDPIAPPEQRAQLWVDFLSFAERSGWPVSVVGAHEEWLDTYRASGLRVTYLGDEAVVDSATFTLDGPAMKSLRHAVSRVDRAGVEVTFHDPARLDPGLLEALVAMSELSRRGGRERGFSMTLSRLFDPADTGLLLSVARDAAGHPVGFVQWIPARDLPGWSLDVMRRDTSPTVPNGVIDTLIVRTLQRLGEQGGGRLGLNFAVLRETIEGAPSSPVGAVEQRLLKAIAPHSQMGTLSHFNAKYRPTWIRRYVARGDGSQLPAAALAVARAEGLIALPDLKGANRERH